MHSVGAGEQGRRHLEAQVRFTLNNGHFADIRTEKLTDDGWHPGLAACSPQCQQRAGFRHGVSPFSRVARRWARDKHRSILPRPEHPAR